ncbi:hypothetical protein FB45DRAFT_838427 [Roridomyces roridus]|uniref:FAD-binding domain-containing protein n=1 Tax=Roridomyces roridus TaxID=1738132 RepID=A0AAD7BIL7_9AGAR|nr:hypothetical protein FB45DRAFT_838427 [Roridomyces roridus]
MSYLSGGWTVGMPTKPIRIAICGAGIGGLTLAVTLGASHRIQVDLYEAGAEISTIGAGISVLARTLEVLQLLGLDERMRERGIDLAGADQQRTGPKFRRSDQPEPGYYFLTDALPKGGLSMARNDLVELLKDSLPPNCTVHLNKRMETYTSSSAVTIHFNDGTTSVTDVLIGADGVHSITRATMFRNLADQFPTGFVYDEINLSREALRKCIDPVWTGTVAYRCVFPAEKLRQVDPGNLVLDDQMITVGKGRHVAAYPIARRTLINFVGFDTIPGGEGTPFPSDKWVEDVPVEEVLKLYKGWEPAIQGLLQCIDKPSRWAIHVTPSLPFYAHGNVAVLGDAAHAMTPHFGAAAGQAIESAYILGRLLSHPTLTVASIPTALSIYSTIRQPFANHIVERSRITGLMYDLSVPGLYDGETGDEEEGLKQIGEAIKRELAWVGRHGIKDDWKRAEGMLLAGGDRV